MSIGIIVTRFIKYQNKMIRVCKSYSKDDLLCIPRKDDLWEDDSFVVDIDGGIAVVSEISFNYDGGYCNVYLDDMNIDDNKNVKYIENILTRFEKNNWEVDYTEET